MRQMGGPFWPVNTDSLQPEPPLNGAEKSFALFVGPPISTSVRQSTGWMSVVFVSAGMVLAGEMATQEDGGPSYRVARAQ